MANKAQILVNRSEDQSFIAPRTFCRAIASQKAFKHSFLTRKCVISTQNQADFVYLIMQNKPNLKIPSLSKEQEEKKGAGREGKNRSEHLLINRMKLILPYYQHHSKRGVKRQGVTNTYSSNHFHLPCVDDTNKLIRIFYLTVKRLF